MSLVLFTVLSQLAAGAVATLFLLEYFGKRVSIATGKLITGSLVAITAFSLAISLFHLGAPLSAYMAITNIGSSWISREIALFLVFFLLLIIYYKQWSESLNESRKKIGGLTSITGIFAVISSGMVYVLPAMPAWNNFTPVLFFCLTAVLLGPLYVAVILIKKNEDYFNLLKIVSTAIVIYAISFAVYLSVVISGSLPQQLTGSNILNSSGFWFRVALSWLIPFAILATAIYKKKKLAFNYLFVILLMIVAGEILGRELFYNSIVALQVGLF